MRALLDTHALIWWWTDRQSLSPRARDLLEADGNIVFASAASAWEIATKTRLGKLPVMAPHVRQLDALIADSDFTPLPIGMNHAQRAGGYDIAHADPFDRMLAAQAELEGLMLVTSDKALAAFPCATLW